MYIGLKVVSLSGGEMEVSAVVFASDLIFLANIFSNHLIYCCYIIRPSVVLTDV